MNLEFSNLARSDLISIGDWIATDNRQRATTFVEELVSTCERLVDFPQGSEIIGRYRKEQLRRKVHGNYLILYTIRDHTIFIVRIINGAMDYTQFLD
jgi:toxin ParE1/3/4